METIYIEKMDKPKWGIKKIKIERDRCVISLDLEKTKNIQKLVKKLKRNEAKNVVLSKELNKNKEIVNSLSTNDINIFDGRWLERYLLIQILDFVVNQKSIKKEETEIAITVNQITDFSVEIIKILAKQYKKVITVTNQIEKLRKLEKEIYDKEGIIIIVSNNQKKSLQKAQIILNIDFNKDMLNKYRINENAIIINLDGDVKIENKRFNGINVNDYEIEVGREEIIWRENIGKYRTKDLLESALYMKDTFQNICSKINKNKVAITTLYGVNGKIERFS